jgi:hypothetical protein
MTAPPDLPRRPAITFAARLEGRDGWVLEETVESVQEVRQRLNQQPERLLELRVLSQGVAYQNRDRWSVHDRLAGLPAAWREGWYYDAVGACWRAPNETIAPPPTSPAWSESLAVAFAPPVAGWIDVTLALRDKSAFTLFSNVHDPVLPLLRFLEGVLAGGMPRFLVDQETDHAEWHVLPAPLPEHWEHRVFMPGPNVRLVMWETDAGGWPRAEPQPPAQKLDLVLPRRALVLSIYRAWRLIALGDKARWSAEWMTHLDQERDGPCYPNGRVIPTDAEMRALLSEALETALAAELRA